MRGREAAAFQNFASGRGAATLFRLRNIVYGRLTLFAYVRITIINGVVQDMVHAAFLSRKRYRAGPSGAATPAVRRYPTRTILPPAPAAPSDGYADMPYPFFLTPPAPVAMAL